MPQMQIRVLKHKKVAQPSEFSEYFINTMEEALRFHPHAALIANPATFHLEAAQKLAEAGIHLLIEKPISTSTVGIEELIQTCKKNKVVLMTGYNLRFSSSLIHFRELVNKKIVGKVLSVRCEVGQYLPDWRPNEDYRLTVSANNRLGGGVLLELSHEIDYLRWIFGEVDWVRATLSRQSALEIDVEDTAHLILGFEPNSEGNQLIASLNLDFIRRDRARSCTLIGETGTLRWDGLNGTVNIYRENSENWEVLFTHSPDADETLLAEWENFLESINKNKIVEPLVTGGDGLRVMEIIQAARNSTLTGSQVMVNKSPLPIEIPL